MALDPIHAFYCSKAYLDLSLFLKIKSEGRCIRCGGIFGMSELRTHHITELTLANIDNIAITLNPSNIEVICHDCHNEVHSRFMTPAERKAKAYQKQVYIVHGSPCSGKTSYVKQVATRDDIIVDLDRLHQAICSCGMYDKPDATKRNAFDMRDLLIDRIKTRAGKWECAYIIGGYPSAYERERLASELRAELVHIDTPKAECITRCIKDIHRATVRDVYIGYIEDYFRRYTA